MSLLLQLPPEILSYVSTYFRPEDALMYVRCNKYVYEMMNPCIIKSLFANNNKIQPGDTVYYRDYHQPGTKETWIKTGRKIGKVTAITAENKYVIDQTITRKASGVRRVRIFPDTISLQGRPSTNGRVHVSCPGCYMIHTHGGSGHRVNDCGQEIKPNPFPLGYFVMLR
jgi:hypothetical protein